MEFRKLIFKPTGYYKTQNARAVYGVSEKLYSVFVDNDEVIRVMYDTHLISFDVQFESIDNAKEYAQKHYEGTCENIIATITAQ